MKIYDNIEAERDRIEASIKKYGWTSDHNLGWWLMCPYKDTGKPVFVQFDDGSGLLTYKYSDEWSVWSDPLTDKGLAAERINEFASLVLNEQIKEVWCVDVSEEIYPALKKESRFKLSGIDYSLFWPVLDMKKFEPDLSGGNFKEMRNAKNKFYREHEVQVVNAVDVAKSDLHKIVDDWKKRVSRRSDIYDLKYHKAIDDDFKGFATARVLVVDGKPAGFNAGYEVPNHPGRFAGVIGLHDYSLKDLGTILWLEDLGWIKNAGYKELDMQGSEDDGGLKLKLRFGAVIERKTETFWLKK